MGGGWSFTIYAQARQIEQRLAERDADKQRLAEQLNEIARRHSRIGPPVPEGKISLRKEKGPL